MKRRYFRSRIPMSLHEADEYFLVDYDFRGAHGQKPHPEYSCFYKKFEEAFGQKLSKYKETQREVTASVIKFPTLEEASKAAQLVEECGGTAYIRKCIRIEYE